MDIPKVETTTKSVEPNEISKEIILDDSTGRKYNKRAGVIKNHNQNLKMCIY